MSAAAFWAATAGYRRDDWERALKGMGDDRRIYVEELEPSPSVSGAIPVPKRQNVEDSFTQKKMMRELWLAMGEDETLFGHLWEEMGQKKLWKMMLKIVRSYGADEDF